MSTCSRLVWVSWLVVICLTACAKSAATATATPNPIPTPTRLIPTPSTPGDSMLWDTLQVTLQRTEVSQAYATDFGSTRVPPANRKFLWIKVRLENLGSIELDLPELENFSVLYAAAELKPSYGHRQGYPDYEALGPVMSPGQALEGWLRFEVPAIAEPRQLRFVFLPESAQVGSSYASPNYPYAEDKPTYVWKLE